MSELIDKIKNAKAELLYASEFVGTPNERATDIERAFQPIFKHFEQPTLNENQLEVLDGLKFIFVNYNQEFGTDGNIKYALRDFYWYLGTDYSILENKKLVSMCESYYLLSADEFSQVLGLFSNWALEQEEE